MGLDMYAYVARKGQAAEYWQNVTWDKDTQEETSSVEKPREIAYWRKHPNLHGWMEQLWRTKGASGDLSGNTFNGVELELTWEDLDELEKTIKKRKLPKTSGFFFGEPADPHYYEHDLTFINKAKAETFMGLKVFYNSSW